LPAIVKILAVFGFVLLLSRSRLHLGFSLLIGSLLLGFWSGQSLASLAGIVARSLIDRSTLLLAAILVLILFLSRLMERSGNLNRIVEAFSRVVRGRRALSALIPALVGIFPLPGGALFSAPLVGTTVQDTDLSSARKTVINYWFRHVWEYWWPLYPGFILAAGLLEVSALRLMLLQFPLAAFAGFAGWLLLLRPLKSPPPAVSLTGRRTGLKILFREASPVFAVLAVIFLLNLLFRLTAVGSVPPELPVLAGMAGGIVLVCRRERLVREDLLGALKGGKYLNYVLLVAAIMIFRGVLAESEIVHRLKEELLDYRIPVLLVVVFLPFVSGLVSGIAIGFVGASFPVILPLLSNLSPPAYLAHAVLAFGCGYMGMMLSPVHLCLLFSRDYFESSLTPCFRLLLPLAGLTLILSGAYFVVFIRLAG
jgi:uncharacterized protein